MTDKLRTGRTTGTCATAAAMAAVLRLLRGESPDTINTPLPPGGTLAVPILRMEEEGESVRVTVLKDGGDDPDATHGHEIQAVVRLEATNSPLVVTIHGGHGVGRATLPGLPVPVGRAAINPVPREQIETGVRMVAGAGAKGCLTVTIEVPEGERIATKTMNARLGILGGISILGTQGIVKPYSHDSWKATIAEGLDVACAQGLDTIIFTTGRRSERLYGELYPGLPGYAFIQAADFFSFAMEAAGKRNIRTIIWSVFFGKLVKQAQGLAYTHAKTNAVDFQRLAKWCDQCGCSHASRSDVLDSVTARHVLELLKDDPNLPVLTNILIERAAGHARTFAGTECEVEYTVFDFDGRRLG